MDVTIRRGNRMVEGRLANASVKGMFIHVAEKLAVNDEVALVLRPPAGQPGSLLTCHGVVLRVEPAGVAVELRHMDKESFAQWRRIVRSHSDDPAKIEEELRGFIGRQ